MIKKIKISSWLLLGIFLIITFSFCTPKGLFAYEEEVFVTRWNTSNVGSSNNNEVVIYAQSLNNNYEVDWGDGQIETGVTARSKTHTYSQPGIYTISIKGTFSGLSFPFDYSKNVYMDSKKLLSVEQWGAIEWESMKEAFRSTENLQINATDTPDISSVTDMSYAFKDALYFNSDLSLWDTSNVTNMSNIFSGATSFNQDISSWDVSNVVSMVSMFSGATSFNNGGQPLDWNTSSLLDFSFIFYGATSFNQDISSWDVSKIVAMIEVFKGATSFNNGGQPLEWDTSSVMYMPSMFSGATSFNQDISSWDVSNVVSMISMFSGATSFNNGDQPLDWEDTSSVTEMRLMFENACSFNQDISSWDVSSVTDMSSMFSIGYNYSAGKFYDSSFNNGGQPLDWEDTSNVTTMRSMFSRATAFNQDVSSLNVSSVTDMSNMFSGATSFNNGGQPLDWNTSSLLDFSFIFYGATSFNQDVSSWDVSKVTTMMHAFSGAASFNNGGQPLDWGDTSSLSSTSNMFYGAISFDQDISSWDVSNVTDMSWMFSPASGLSIVNYDALLESWSQQELQRNVTFDAGKSYYLNSGNQKQSMIDNFNWEINDNGTGTHKPYLNYYGKFQESFTNNGAISGTITASLAKNSVITNKFVNQGGFLNKGQHYSVSPNIPGLTPVISINSNGDTASLNFSGYAKKHTADFSLDNLTIEFSDSAFVNKSLEALDIQNKKYEEGKLVFSTNMNLLSNTILYGADGDRYNPGNTKFYTLDQLSGDIITEIGDMGHDIVGMDFHPETGVLYGNTSARDYDGGKTFSLFTIDIEDGSATWIGYIKTSEGKLVGFNDIVFGSNGILYGRANWEGEAGQPYLYTISYNCSDSNCLASPVSSVGIGDEDSGALDFDSEGSLYVFNSEYEGNFYKVDPVLGEILESKEYVNYLDGVITAAKFNHNNNTFYLSRNNWSDNPADLVTINVDSGEMFSLGEKVHLVYMSAIAFKSEGGVLNHGQTVPTSSGIATLSGETNEVIIDEEVDSVTIHIEDDVIDPVLALSSLITLGTTILPNIEIITNFAEVYIPAGNITVSDSSWEGRIKAPSRVEVRLPRNNVYLSKALEMGYPGNKIIFEKSVKIIIKGESGKKVGYFDVAGEFHDIASVCVENSQSWADENLSLEGDCRIDAGSDLIIWTKHFTKFATYTEETSSSSSSRIVGYRSPAKIAITPTAETQVVNPVTTTTTYNFGNGLIKQGQRSVFVKELQRYLNINLGLKLEEDGIFGPITKSAVILFQKNNSLTPDGVVGSMTKGKMK